MDVLEVASFVATVIGGIAILFAVRDYAINRKHLNLAALESCITRFREQFLSLDAQASEAQVLAYVDFVNEELFYFEHGFLPLGVAEEWLDGMIDLLPLYDPAGQVVNEGHCLPQVIAGGWLETHRFRRVRRVFTLQEVPDLGPVYAGDEAARQRLVAQLVRNLRRRRRLVNAGK